MGGISIIKNTGRQIIRASTSNLYALNSDYNIVGSGCRSDIFIQRRYFEAEVKHNYSRKLGDFRRRVGVPSKLIKWFSDKHRYIFSTRAISRTSRIQAGFYRVAQSHMLFLWRLVRWKLCLLESIVEQKYKRWTNTHVGALLSRTRTFLLK